MAKKGIKYQSMQRRIQRVRQIDTTQIGQQSINLPFYAGASDHFGEIGNKQYARGFFDELFKDRI